MKSRLSLNVLPACVIILVFFTTWALFHIWTRHMATDLGYRISAEQSLKDELLGENKSLRLEISTLKSSKRLEAIARDKLGMGSPKPDQVVYLWTSD